jgi:hypothetical protein
VNAIVRNHEGVVLDYADPRVLRAYHVERKQHRSDRDRIAVIGAEHALIAFEIIFEHLDLSNIALTRIDDGFRAIYRGLRVRRRGLGLAVA